MVSVVDVLSNFEINAKWLRKNYDDLKNDFNNEWVAVLDESVLDHDTNLERLVKRLKSNHGKVYNQIAVEYVTTEELDLIL